MNDTTSLIIVTNRSSVCVERVGIPAQKFTHQRLSGVDPIGLVIVLSYVYSGAA